LIGTQRAGTTLLDRLLEAHPETYVPCRHKEIMYFDCHLARGTRVARLLDSAEHRLHDLLPEPVARAPADTLQLRGHVSHRLSGLI
jgi:hypothetical protein